MALSSSLRLAENPTAENTSSSESTLRKRKSAHRSYYHMKDHIPQILGLFEGQMWRKIEKNKELN